MKSRKGKGIGKVTGGTAGPNVSARGYSGKGLYTRPTGGRKNPKF